MRYVLRMKLRIRGMNGPRLDANEHLPVGGNGFGDLPQREHLSRISYSIEYQRLHGSISPRGFIARHGGKMRLARGTDHG